MILDEEAGVTQGMLLGEEAGYSSVKIISLSRNISQRIVLYEGMLLDEEAGYSSAKIDLLIGEFS